MRFRISVLSTYLERCHPFLFSAWCIAGAFTTYFSMYAFRKPFTAATYEGETFAGIDYKIILVAAQVAGYTLSKLIGVKVISEMKPAYRAIGIVILIAIAHAVLLLFAIVPAPYNFPLLFLNGLPLGMVFGLVLGYLEGRRVTEALAAGLCASFILSSGVVKTVGSWLMQEHGISEYWMPFWTGALFWIPLLIGVWMLVQVPPPSVGDIVARAARPTINARERWSFFLKYALGLSMIVSIYILLTILRGIRDDFAPEIWSDLGYTDKPDIFARSEFLVMIGVTLTTGSAIIFRSNRVAFLTSMGLVAAGFVLVLLSVLGWVSGWLSPFAFMVLIGLGLYVPYVAIHTTIFERLIAGLREKTNIGFLMYLADSTGYLALVVLLVWKDFGGLKGKLKSSPTLFGEMARNWIGSGSTEMSYLPFFIGLAVVVSLVSLLMCLIAAFYFRQRLAEVKE